MLKRLLLGLVLGLVMGSLVAAAFIKGLGGVAFSMPMAYLFAAVTGVVTGLVAGKPIWASGGQIEAGLKAGFGALVAAGMMYVLRHWVHLDIHLGEAISAYTGSGQLSDLPAFSLPLIAALLGAFYSADNTPTSDDEGGKSKGVEAKKAPSKKMRVAAAIDDDELDAEGESAPAKRAKR